jgi:hypothetical protein
MPSPWSLTSITRPPLPVCIADTDTPVVGGEYRSALSSNSASTWTRSPATAPTTSLSGTVVETTRV